MTTMTTMPQHYSGCDTFGRRVEVAQRADGRWFSRCYRFNGYAVAPTKWTATEVTWMTESVDAKGEPVTFREPVMTWGFQRLDRTNLGRIRLPKE